VSRARSLLLAGAGGAPAAIGPCRPVPVPAPGPGGRLRAWGLGAAGCALALGAGGAVALSPTKAMMALVVVGLVACVYCRPPVAAYLVIFLTPLLAGIDRGSVIPFFRPNEAIDLAVGGGLLLRGLVRTRSGLLPRLKLDSLEWTLVAMAVTSSIIPLIWLYVRNISPTSDDIEYSLVLWKYFGLYLLIRFSIRTLDEVRRALWLSMAACAIVCIVAILQSVNKFGVPHLLATYYAPFGVDGALTISRGSSLLSLPAAVGDLGILNLAIVVGMLSRGIGNKWLLFGLGGLFLTGIISSAEFSSVIALLIAAVALGVVTGGRRIASLAAPGMLVGGYALRDVIGTRLAGFDSSTGLPVSWVGRLNNLRTYFWPTLFSNWNWLLGVRPAARVPSVEQAFGYVWIESGYTWLLWGGGLPLLGSYFAFAFVAMRRAFRLARVPEVIGAAALSVLAVMASQLVVMLFDPHLTYRGSADALFALLALSRPQLLSAAGSGRAGRATARAKEGAKP
jgi:hypothetical protein